LSIQPLRPACKYSVSGPFLASAAAPAYPRNKNKIIHALFVEPPAPYDSSRMDKAQFDHAEIKRILLRPSVLYLTGVCR